MPLSLQTFAFSLFLAFAANAQDTPGTNVWRAFSSGLTPVSAPRATDLRSKSKAYRFW